MKLSPEVNLMAVAHYLKALDYQRKAAQAVAILGGKNPHIQNLVVGGVATAINMENLATLNMERLAYLRTLMEETRDFVQKVYYPDVLAIAARLQGVVQRTAPVSPTTWPCRSSPRIPKTPASP